MMADLRYLLAIYVHAHRTGNSVPPHIDAEARAALGEADEPAVPQGREPATADLEKEFRYWWKETYGSPYFGTVPLVAVLLWTECVLARRGNPAPQPPADGEVAELVAWLRETGDAIQPSHLAEHQRYKRAAELLERLSPLQPVPVSERLPGPEDCDANGRCWWGRSESHDWSADWTFATYKAVAEFCEFSPRTTWLPAHALPLPEVDE